MGFIDNNDGTITDTETNLIWQKSDDGIKRTYSEAISYSFNLKLGGYIDWRLPTIKELISIIDYQKFNPSIDPIFDCKSDYYLSGSDYTVLNNGVWGIYFYNGCVNYCFKNDYDNDYYVRCVLNSQRKE